MRGYNAEKTPKGIEAQRYALTSDDTLADLLGDLEEVPELDDRPDQRARALARLDDAARVDQARFELSLDGPVDGPATRQLFEDLWLYAWPVLKAFLRTGRMSGLVRQYAPHLHGAIHPEDMVVLHAAEAERDALSIDVISRTVKDFRESAIIKGGWKAYEAGASVRTYFIGSCALNFPRAYAKWSADRGGRVAGVARANGIDLDAVGEHIAARVPDPSSVAADRDDLRRMIDKAQPMTKVILGLLTESMSQIQIAAELRMTVRAVEGRMYRFRQKVLAHRRSLATIIDPSDQGGDLW
jgi:hypothetical protein